MAQLRTTRFLPLTTYCFVLITHLYGAIAQVHLRALMAQLRLLPTHRLVSTLSKLRGALTAVAMAARGVGQVASWLSQPQLPTR